MKKSIYNFFFKDDNNKINLVYNAFKNTLIEDEDGRMTQLLNKLSVNETDLNKFKITEEELCILKNNGFIVDDTIDELEIVKETHQKRIEAEFNSDSVLSLVITPTMACNFNCFYCFEGDDIKGKETRMGVETQEILLSFIEKSLQRGIKVVAITWYGGEPLMEKEIIFKLQNKINLLCKQYGIPLKASMITNGFLMDANTSREIEKTGISRVQITIDGPERIHNKRRLYKKEPGNNFKTIIQNILDAPDSLFIRIRMNIDLLNKDSVYEAVEEFIKYKVWPYKPRVRLTIALVHSDNEAFPVISKKDYFIFEEDFREFLSRRFSDLMPSTEARYRFKYPQTGGGGCPYGSQKNFWVVDFKGNTYRCWDVVGNNKLTTGNLRDMMDDYGHSAAEKLIIDNKQFEKWGCYECKYFPICGSDCPWNYLIEKDESRKCTEWKYSLEMRLIRQYAMYKKNPSMFKTKIFAE